jgi:hypothetical protein
MSTHKSTMPPWDAHKVAMSCPWPPETTIVFALRAATSYVEHYRETCDGDVADDSVLCCGVAMILGGVLVLLDGDIGRLDAGECWSEVERIALRAGWKSVDEMRADA